VTGDGVVSVAVTSTSSDGAYYDAREAGPLGPQLVVTTGPDPSPTPTGAEGDPVLVGAGDISTCSNDNDEATARLLDAIPGSVFTAGDNAYPNGSPNDFASCYGPTWGRHLARTHPAVGNHEYTTAGAGGYFGYFGAAAGDPTKGYYSYDLGSWHVIALNSNCSIVSCADGSAQEQWLRADLSAHPSTCTAAYWHHPRFTSGTNHPPELAVGPLVQALYDLGADVVVTGHNHHYERFAPLDPGGSLDPLRGIAEFVVGTGGAELYGFGTPQVGSEARSSGGHGVLKLTLHPTGYDWQFVPVPGNPFTDAGSASCH
jgi:acid phosphatase type 7